MNDWIFLASCVTLFPIAVLIVSSWQQKARYRRFREAFLGFEEQKRKNLRK